MRTRRLHARLAYVIRVDNRASVAYAAASTSARTPRPSRVAYVVDSCRPRLRCKKCRCEAAHRTLGLRYALFARHAESHDAQKTTARTLMRTLGKSLRHAPKPCDNHIQRDSISASSRLICSAITRDKMHCDPSFKRMAANSASVSGSMHLSCTAKLRSSALYGQVK
jgi:hypothetical protein